MTPRNAVYAALDSERDYQDDKFSVERVGREAIDRTFDEFILYIKQYADEAGALTTHENEDEALHFVRKVGALCVGCMEKHGAPQREGFERDDRKIPVNLAMVTNASFNLLHMLKNGNRAQVDQQIAVMFGALECLRLSGFYGITITEDDMQAAMDKEVKLTHRVVSKLKGN